MGRVGGAEDGEDMPFDVAADMSFGLAGAMVAAQVFEQAGTDVAAVPTSDGDIVVGRVKWFDPVRGRIRSEGPRRRHPGDGRRGP